MQFAHNGSDKGSIPFGLKLRCSAAAPFSAETMGMGREWNYFITIINSILTHFYLLHFIYKVEVAEDSDSSPPFLLLSFSPLPSALYPALMLGIG